MFCNKCGKELPDNAAFCSECGAKPYAQAASSGYEGSSGLEGGKASLEDGVAPVIIPKVNNAQPPQQQPKKKSKKGIIIAIIAVILAFAIGVTGTYFIVKNNNESDDKNEDYTRKEKLPAVEVTTKQIIMDEDLYVDADEFTTAVPVEVTTVPVTINEVDPIDFEEKTTTVRPTNPAPEVVTQPYSDSVNNWTKAEILAAYNKAVKKTDPVAPSGNSTMKLVGGITGDGAIGGLLEVLSPATEKALAKNSTPTNFIPGYGEIKGEDLKGIKVTDNGRTYTIQMEIKSQTDGPEADDKAGPVGRAIGTLGSIDGALRELGATFKSGKDTVTLTYDNVTIRAEIDKSSGLIVHGQWHYVVKARIGDAKMSISIITANVKNLVANIDYTVVI